MKTEFYKSEGRIYKESDFNKHFLNLQITLRDRDKTGVGDCCATDCRQIKQYQLWTDSLKEASAFREHQVLPRRLQYILLAALEYTTKTEELK